MIGVIADVLHGLTFVASLVVVVVAIWSLFNYGRWDFRATVLIIAAASYLVWSFVR